MYVSPPQQVSFRSLKENIISRYYHPRHHRALEKAHPYMPLFAKLQYSSTLVTRRRHAYLRRRICFGSLIKMSFGTLLTIFLFSTTTGFVVALSKIQ